MKLRFLAIGLAACLLAVAGCGSSDDNSSSSGSGSSTQSSNTSSSSTSSASSGVAQAKALLTKNEQPTKWTPPGPAFKLDPSITQGKTLCIVAAQLNFDFTKQLVSGATAGAKLGGMKVQALDSQGSPATAIRVANQCMAQGADALVFISYPAVVVKSVVTAAKKKGMPVVIFGEQDSGLPSASDKALGVFGHATACSSCAGQQMGTAAVALSDGKPFKTTFISVPTSQTTADELKGYKEQVTAACPSCEVENKDVDFAQWATQLKPAASAAIAGGSQVIAPSFDAMVSLMLPAVSQSGGQGKVQFNSFNATLPILKLLKSGNTIQADVGSSNAWGGWNVVDQVFRAFNKQEPAEKEYAPERTFTKNNIDSVDLSGDPASWTGPVVFPGEFKKLWGLG